MRLYRTGEQAAARRPLMRDLRRIFALSAPYRRRLVFAIAFSICAALAALALPLGLRALLDAVFESGDSRVLHRLVPALFLLCIVQALTSVVGRYQLQWIGQRIVSDLRQQVYAHLHRISLRYFASTSVGDMTSRLTNDVGAIRTAVTDSLVTLLTTGLRLVGSVCLMFAINWRLSALTLLIVPPAAWAARSFGELTRRLSRMEQDCLAETTAIASETLSGIRVVRSFGRSPYENERYQKAVEGFFETARKRALASAAFSSTIALLFYLVLIAVLWYGGIEVLAGRLSAGDMVAFVFYANGVAIAVQDLSMLYGVFNGAAGAAERLFELLDTKPEVRSRRDAFVLPAFGAAATPGALRFRNVSFAYGPEAPVLREIDVEIRAGETVALVGPSGAGKSTMLNLIPRFHDPTEGSIELDGRDLRTILLQSLRQQIAIVGQDVHLFSTTIRENIRYGRLDATDDDVEVAARMANAHDFIETLPGGYDTHVGERGVRLSGGQKQRISIARALLICAPIVLLDEATSALDSGSEALIQQALEGLTRSRTTLVIAHRLSTVRNADRILVMEDGRIVQQGNHRELLAQEGLYRELAAHQFGEEVMRTPVLVLDDVPSTPWEALQQVVAGSQWYDRARERAQRLGWFR
jgi:subfamily B ATP-binding cassette protein MsbA